MVKEFEIYTGELEYKGINFTFMFNKKELRLIPPKDKVQEIEFGWFAKEISPGCYSFGELPCMEVPFLEGTCNEDGRKIIFIVKQGSSIGRYNAVLTIPFIGYILCRFHRDFVDRMNFSGPEIDCIHPIRNAFSFAYGEDSLKNGVFTIKTKNFEETTTERQKFTLDGKEVHAHFSITRGIGVNIGDTPLKLHSSLTFDFDSTDNKQFLFDLWRVAKRFIQYLCYSNNITFNKVELLAPYEEGMHEGFAEMVITADHSETDLECLKKGHYIPQKYLSGFEGLILNDIAESRLYIRHLPETYEKGRHIDTARFIMIIAAFEWELRNVFPEYAKQKQGKRRVTLAEKIENAGNAMSSIMDIFGIPLYRLNNEELDYQAMGKRLAKQRNNFSHGNLDQEFDELSLLDLVFMEYMIYGMQLKKYGMPDKKIQSAINALFQRHIMIPDK